MKLKGRTMANRRMRLTGWPCTVKRRVISTSRSCGHCRRNYAKSNNLTSAERGQIPEFMDDEFRDIDAVKDAEEHRGPMDIWAILKLQSLKCSRQYSPFEVLKGMLA